MGPETSHTQNCFEVKFPHNDVVPIPFKLQKSFKRECMLHLNSILIGTVNWMMDNVCLHTFWKSETRLCSWSRASNYITRKFVKLRYVYVFLTMKNACTLLLYIIVGTLKHTHCRHNSLNIPIVKLNPFSMVYVDESRSLHTHFTAWWTGTVL